ncbi:peptidoglycan bridge formation glycyltransferase FemA/FemB family protein [Streptococcus fryi]
MTLKLLSYEELQSFTQQVSRCSFEQTTGMAKLLEKRGYDVSILGLTDHQEEIQVAAILFLKKMFGGFKGEIHYGPTYKDRQFLEPFLSDLISYAKSKKILTLEIKPYDTYQSFDSNGQPTSDEDLSLIRLYQNKGFTYSGLTSGFETSDWHYLKNLNDFDEQTLLKDFNKNSVRNIKAAKQFGIKIRHIAFEDINDFKNTIDETGKRQGFVGKNLDYYQYLYQSFENDSRFLVAEINFHHTLQEHEEKLKNLNPNHKQYQQLADKYKKTIETLSPLAQQHGDKDVILASVLLIFSPTEATYVYGGSYADFQKFSAPFLLQYHAMCETIAKNIKRYNFLGITGDFDGSDGVLRFKQNFNGYIERRPGSFFYYPKPLKLKIITLIKKLLNRH